MLSKAEFNNRRRTSALNGHDLLARHLGVLTMIIRQRHTRNFTILPNAIYDDGRISLDTLGLLTFLLSRPRDWEVRHDALRRKFGVSTERLARMLSELKSAGYLVRDLQQPRDEQMRFSPYAYEVRDTPIHDQSATGSPSATPRRRKSVSGNKKEEIKNSDTNLSPTSPLTVQVATTKVCRDRYSELGRRARAVDMKPVFVGSAPYRAWLRFRGPDGMPPVDQATINGRHRELVWLPSIYPPGHVAAAEDCGLERLHEDVQ